MERRMDPAEVASASLIQAALDDMSATGGRIVLPVMDLELDRGLRLHTGVILEGQGAGTILRKGPGRIYPLSGYHNYGMCDVPVDATDGLEVGMTVSIHDDRTHGGFYETLATITGIEKGWVRLDHGIEADYLAEESPCLTTAYPMIYGHGIGHAGIRNLCLEGNRAENERAMGGCRGSAVYFYRSHQLEVSGVSERDYNGEGIGFQMCRDVVVKDCTSNQNIGNGLHPGAGSTNVLFEGCTSSGNEKSGFFFCVRANHVTVRDCTFRYNAEGISIGTRDCHNLIEDCAIERNREAGILVRRTPSPTEVHSCMIRDCWISGNATDGGRGQVELVGDAHDLQIQHNRISGTHDRELPGIFAESSVRRIHLMDNMFENCVPEVSVPRESLLDVPLTMTFGYGTTDAQVFQHLGL